MRTYCFIIMFLSITIYKHTYIWSMWCICYLTMYGPIFPLVDSNVLKENLKLKDSKFSSLIFSGSMMHCNIHSALAIKRQRKRRDDQKRARERRYSLQSTESGENHSPHGSTRRKHRSNYGRPNNVDSKVRCTYKIHIKSKKFLIYFRIMRLLELYDINSTGCHIHRDATHRSRFCSVWNIFNRRWCYTRWCYNSKCMEHFCKRFMVERISSDRSFCNGPRYFSYRTKRDN